MLSKELQQLYNQMTPLQQKEIVKVLISFISDHKQNLFQRYIQYRTRHITVVLEDLFQPHNSSAVLRTCDCFGIQDTHIIENNNLYEVNPDITLGSDQWLNIYTYNNTTNNTVDCITKLKQQGYRIVATTPHKDGYTLEQYPIDKKFALVFGAELPGLSQDVFNMADDFVKIPMFGFTESFNISVSAAIMLHTLTGKLRKSNIAWQLSPDEQTDILFSWACSVVKKPHIHIQQILNT